jgi:iron-sulfur cluster assembly accessory protein
MMIQLSNNTEKPMNLLTFSEKAIEFLSGNLASHAGALGVRISLKKAGCSGLQYVLDYVTSINPQDELIELKNLADVTLNIYVDKQAIPYIIGSHVDYVREGLNGKIQFINPNEKNSCGCGESFLV